MFIFNLRNILVRILATLTMDVLTAVNVKSGFSHRCRPVSWADGLHSWPPRFSSTAGYFYFSTGQFLHETPPDKGVGYCHATITFRF